MKAHRSTSATMSVIPSPELSYIKSIAFCRDQPSACMPVSTYTHVQLNYNKEISTYNKAACAENLVCVAPKLEVVVLVEAHD